MPCPTGAWQQGRRGAKEASRAREQCWSPPLEACVWGWRWATALFCWLAGLPVCRNPTFITTDYTDPASCPYRHNGRALLEDPSGHGGDDPRTFSLPQFVHLTGAWLVVSALLALGLGAAFIHLFKHHSHTMTRVTIVSQIAVRELAGLV